jgi:predicted dehydrogenase
MRVAIIGSGLQSKRRIEAIQENGNDEISIILGINPKTLKDFSDKYKIQTTENCEEIFGNPKIDIIVICTPPSSHAYYIRKSLETAKKVLVEKPIFQSSQEMMSLCEDFGDQIDLNVYCGFNHRFHPAISQMKKRLDDGAIGNPLFARSVYGISARSNYQNEWRSNPDFAAGGQFIEQGSHIIDLFQWMLGTPTGIYCKTTNLLFKDAVLEDGGMAILAFEKGVTAQMHTTLAQWHNEFRFEIFGDKGFLRVVGLGNTYGVETLEVGMREEAKPFSSEIIQFRGADVSWKGEWEALKNQFEGNPSPIATFRNGVNVMKIAEAAYLSNRNASETFLKL